MTTFVVGLLVGLAAAAVLAWGFAHRRHEVAEGARREAALALLAQARGADGRPRYLVELLDQRGPGVAAEMGWRWIVWDADRDLRVEAHPDEDPEGQAGVEVPHMLGNQVTRIAALVAAADWVGRRGADSMVLEGER